MCLVIDINAFHSVFEASSSDYLEFEPVYRWLCGNSRSKLVYGGSRYREELVKMGKYLGYLVELKRSRRVAEIDDGKVDEKETELIRKVNRADFDDAHIVAIFAVSGCRVYCSKDKRSFKYLKRKSLYPKGQKPPSIYTRRNNEHLLCAENIVDLKNQVR